MLPKTCWSASQKGVSLQATNPVFSETEEAVQLTAAAEHFSMVVDNAAYVLTAPEAEGAGRASRQLLTAHSGSCHPMCISVDSRVRTGVFGEHLLMRG